MSQIHVLNLTQYLINNPTFPAGQVKHKFEWQKTALNHFKNDVELRTGMQERKESLIGLAILLEGFESSLTPATQPLKVISNSNIQQFDAILNDQGLSVNEQNTQLAQIAQQINTTLQGYINYLNAL